MMSILESTKTLLRDKLMKEQGRENRTDNSEDAPSDSSEDEDEDLEQTKKAVKRSVSPFPQRSKRRIIEDSVEQVLRDTIFQLSVNKLQFPRWRMHEPPLSRTVLIWNMVRIIDKEIQEERVVDDVLSLLGEDSNVKFIKVCRTETPTEETPDKENTVEQSPEVEMSEVKPDDEEDEDTKDESEEEDADTVQFITDLNDIELLLGNSSKSNTGWGCLEQSEASIAV